MTLAGGATQTFAATVTNDASNAGVTWSASSGTISAAGLYTAPSPVVTGTATVTAVSKSDTSKSASATVTLTPISVSITPTAATLSGGDTQGFTATVANDGTNSGVTWSVSAGTITAAGLYTAPVPVTSSSATVTATSKADPAKSASATVTLVPISLALTSGASVTLDGDGVQSVAISASILGDSSASGATFVVSGGGTMSAGTVSGNSPTSTFTAPVVTSSTSSTVKVASVKDPSQSQSVSITLNPPMSFVTAPGALSGATIGVSYSDTSIAVTGGTGAKVFSIASGTLPAGLSLSTTGAITGVPAGPNGTSSFTVRVQDQTTPRGTLTGTFSINVTTAPVVLASITPAVVIAGSANFGLTVSGSGFVYGSTIQINGVAQSTSFSSSTSLSSFVTAAQVASVGSLSITVVNPSPGIATSNTQQLQIVGADNRLRTLPYPTLDIVSDPVHNLLYASVSSGSSTSPNSIVAIDPLLGTVVSTQTMAGQPGQLAITDDGNYLYVVVGGSGQISRLKLPSLAPDIQWSSGSYSPLDIEAAPGQPHTLAVTGGVLSSTNTVVIYDDGVARKASPAPAYPEPSFDTVAWGKDASSLYGTMAVTSGGPEFIFSVDGNGVVLNKTIYGVFSDFVRRLTFEKTDNRLYDGYGNTADAPTGNSVGHFNVQNTISYEPNPFAIDKAHGKAFFLNSNYFPPIGGGAAGEDIQAFDLTTFSYINGLVVPGISGGKITSWGTSGLAIGGGSTIYIIDGSFVGSGITSPVGGYVATSPTLTSLVPQSVQAGSPDTTVAITGKNFTQAALATWNGKVLTTTWQSSTQITAAIPASLLATAQGAPLYVSNGPSTEISNSLSFVVLPGLGANLEIGAVNVSGQDMVWDSSQNLLYVAVTNPASSNGNSVAIVDPAALAVKNTVYTGNQPGVLGISDDDHFLYVGFQTLPSVQRYALPGFTTDLAIPLNSGSVSENFAGEIKVAPGQNQTIAVTMGNIDIEPRSAGGLAIYDNAVKRTNGSSGFGAYKVTWGKDATRIYAQSDPEIQAQGLSILTVDSSGILSVTGAQTNGTYLGLRPHYDAGTGLVYSDGGEITNADGTSAGEFRSSGLMVPDSALNRAFVLRSTGVSGSYALDIFDLQRQTLLNSISLPGIVGNPYQFVRWGTQGLAILTDSQSGGGGMLYVLQGSDISGLSAPPMGAITLAPSKIVAGASAGTTVVVTGAGFLPASTVLVNGVPRATAFVSATQVSFQVTTADQTFARFLAVAVTNVSPGSATTPATSLEVDNPSPSISSLSAASAFVGSGGATITLSGLNFLPASVVQFAGKTHAASYLSSTQMSVALTSTDLAATGKFSFTVSNPGPGGGTSAPAAFEIDNPAPVITSLSPNVVATGSGAQSVYLSGSGLIPSTVVQVNGSPRPATYQGSSSVRVDLTAADVASPGSLSIVAINGAPGGGTSAAASLAVNNGLPGPITLTPNVVVKGTATETTITVTGTNFMPGSVMKVTNSPRVTTYVSSTQLTFQLTVADQATAGTFAVSVVNPSPGGGTAFTTLSVVAATATPVISSVYPTQIVMNSGTNFLQVTGTGITANSTINWNGTPLSGTSSFGTTTVSAFVPASLLTAVGTATVTVTTPSANPSVSNALTVNVVAPSAPVLTSVSPSYGPFHTAFTATLNGSNFTSNSAVTLNGVSVPATFASSTQLTVPVNADAALPGNNTFTVTTPAPGGGTSSTATFTAYVPIANNSMVYNPSNQLLYLSVPSSAPAPYGNSIVSLDPLTGALGRPIYVGSEPDRLALSSDGRYLWVGLNGAGSVRKVDLSTGTAGLQFAIPTSASYYAPLQVTALVALPGQADSVVVAAADQYFDSTLTIYDSGVARPGAITLSVALNALQVDGTRNEVYAGSYGYTTYTYSASGLVSKASANPAITVTAYDEDRIQLLAGRAYTDHGSVLDAESGAQLGVFSSPTLNPAPSLPVALDAASGLAFVLSGSGSGNQSPNQIQLFKISDFSQAGSSAIPLSTPTTIGQAANGSEVGLIRWGTNGLAFRNKVSVTALRSNLVKDLSTLPADLAVTLSTGGANTTGGQTTYTATVSNAGPSAATEVVLAGSVPSTGVLVSATPTVGFCTSTPTMSCNLGTLNSGASASVVLVVNQFTPGTATATVNVSASETDPNLTNNQATSSTTITGSVNTVIPTVQSVSPNAILTGSTDTTITITGTGFGAGTTIQVDGVALSTTVVSSTQVSAIVPASSLAALGWKQITCSNPAPGGGTSAVLPLTLYSALKAGANHILYEPFTRQILATVGSAMPLGNSVEAISPETGTVATPIAVGSEPTRMALSDDSQILYVLSTGSDRVVRFNTVTKQTESFFPVSPSFGGGAPAADNFAVQPGSEDTIALTQGVAVTPGLQIVDFSPATHTAAARPSTANVSPSSPQFLDANNLLVTAGLTNKQFARFPLSSSGVGSAPSSYLSADYGPFKLASGMAFTSNGGVADVTSIPNKQLGTFPVTFSNTEAAVAPDPAIGRVFFLSSFDGTRYTSTGVSGLLAFDSNTFTAAGFFPLTPTSNGFVTATALDVIRWGQDGVAALTNDGTVYLVRGPVVLPQLLQTHTAPTLTASVPGSVTHGAGNSILVLSGTNFLPGVAVSWNGAYRTTTLIDSTHVSVNIPASDLAIPGTVSLTASNPGSSSSSPLVLTVN
ncbi:MAG TPA: IPT/TIG domain-containing protein [Acidobacteriaceae bacterium]